MRVTRRSFVGHVGRAGAVTIGGLALGSRGAEAATGWLARGAPAPAVPAALVRLDSNENPVGPPPDVLDAIRDALSHVGRYPRFMGSGLVEDLARFHGVRPDQIALGAGSGEILRMAVDAFTTPARGVVAGLPTFESPAARARQLGRPVIEVPVHEETLQLDLDGMVARAREAGLVFVCNPNNPTGTLHSGKAMRAFLGAVRSSAPEAYVLIDEAYHDYVEDVGYESAVPLAVDDPQVFVTRTFSKAFGMAGIRLGYAIGHADTMKKLSAWRLGNSVNLLAFAAGRAAIRAHGSLAAERARNAAARAYTMQVFTDLGFRVLPSHANFVFVDIRRDASAFQEACRARGVMVGRPFPPFATWTRVSIGTMEEVRRAIPVLGAVLAEAPTAALR